LLLEVVLEVVVWLWLLGVMYIWVVVGSVV
jgi:hypothetical protein